MTVALSNESFGLIRDTGKINKGPRGLEGFLAMLAEQDYPACRLSFAMLVSSDAFYPAVIRAAGDFVRRQGWARLAVMNREIDAGIDPTARHASAAQRRRRSTLARLRNTALAHGLDTEDAVLWVDADITAMPGHTLGSLVDSGKDIVTTITKGWDESVYDLNAWRLPRLPYNASQGPDFVPGPVPGVTRLPQDFEKSPDPFVPIDSVGGCTTLVRADAHREGALFATHYAVGTTWEGDGFDGIETEGLCYTAQFLGRSCWLAAHIVTYHQSYWVPPPAPSPAPSPAPAPA
ncbi:MAG: hypothetical protein J3K34DRAFT_399862 [Monoraphidium minutum]|nr:MAG: hypothetical protein J3K34DRAFT_399862 [Monoraphidium minutum]